MTTLSKTIVEPGQRSALATQVKALPLDEAAAVIERAQPSQAAEALQELNPAIVQSILAHLDKGARRLIAASAPPEVAEQWKRNTQYPEGTIGHMMEAPLAVFRPDMTVGESIEALRPLVRTAFVTYIYVVDAEHRLLGLVTMRDLLFNDREARLEEIMLKRSEEHTSELQSQ